MPTQSPDYERNNNKRALIYGAIIGLMMSWSILMIQLTQGEELFIIGTGFFIITLLGSRWIMYNMNWAYHLAFALVFSIVYVLFSLLIVVLMISMHSYWPFNPFNIHFQEETLLMIYFVGSYISLFEIALYIFRKNHKL